MEHTLFFGNGINRLNTENISWVQLLKVIMEPRIFEDKQLPNTLIYERIILERPKKDKDLLFDEFEVKNKIAELMSEIKINKYYNDLYNIMHKTI